MNCCNIKIQLGAAEKVETKIPNIMKGDKEKWWCRATG